MGNQQSNEGISQPSDNKGRSTLPPKEATRVADGSLLPKKKIINENTKISFPELRTRNNLLPNVTIPSTIIYNAPDNQITSVKNKLYSAIGFLKIKWESALPEGSGDQKETGEYLGNGTLIGPNIVLTAASLLELPGKKITSIYFSPGVHRPNELPFGEIEVKDWEIHTPESNETTESEKKLDRDFAILVLDSEIGMQTGYINYKPLTAEELDGAQVVLAGYLSNEVKEKVIAEFSTAKRDDRMESDIIPLIYQTTGKILSSSENAVKLKISTNHCPIGSGLILSSTTFENLIVGLQVQNSVTGTVVALRITEEIVDWIDHVESNYFFQRERLAISNVKKQNNMMEEIEKINKMLRANNPIHSNLVTLYIMKSTGPRSTVYKVYDPYFKKFYALKRVNLVDDKNAETIAMKELKVMIKLAKFQTTLKDYKKNQFLNIYEIQYSPGEYITYLTELGIGTLSSYNQFRRVTQNPVTEDEVKLILDQIYLHALLLRIRRIYHRDIKPSNIIISDDFFVKFTDFGVAELLDDNQNELGNFPVCGTELFWPEIIKESFADNKKYAEFNIWSAEQEMIANTIKVLFKDNNLEDDMIDVHVNSKSMQLPEEQQLLQILDINPENRILYEEFNQFKAKVIVDQATRHNFLAICKSLLDRASLQESTNLANIFRPVSKTLKAESDYIFIKAHIEQMLDSHQRAIEKYTEFLKAKEDEISDLERAHVLDSMASSHLALNNFDKVIELAEESLSLKRKVLKEGNMDFIPNYSIMGKAFKIQSKFDKALEFYQKVYDMQLEVIGKKNLETLNCVIALAELKKLQTNNEDSNNFYKAYRRIALDMLLEYHSDDPAILALQSQRRSFLGSNEEPKGEKEKDVTLKKDTFQRKTLESASVYDIAAWMLEREKNTKGALMLYKKALDIRITLLGEESLVVATSLGHIGYLSIGKKNQNLDQAIESLTRCLEIRQKHLGENNMMVAVTLDGLGMAYSKKSEFEKAYELQKKGLEIRIKILGEENYYVAESYSWLGNLFELQGKFTEAIEYQQKCLKIKAKIFGEESLSVGHCYNILGNIYENQKNFDQALENFKKSYELIFKSYQKETRDTSKIYYNIGKLYLVQSKYPEAEQYLEKCLNIRIDLLGETSPQVAQSYDILGDLYSAKGDRQKAVENFEKCIKIRNDLAFEPSSEHADILTKLATVYKLLKNNQKALDSYELCANVLRESLGDMNLPLANTYFNIAGIYNELKESPRALSFLTSCLRIRESLLGKNHLDVAKAYFGLAFVLEETSRFDDAIDTYEKCIKIKALSCGENSGELGESYYRIGNIHFKRGFHTKAIEYLSKAQELYNKLEKVPTARLEQIKAMLEVVTMLKSERRN